MSQTLGSPGGEGRRPGTLHGPGRTLARIRAYLHVNLIHNSASPPTPPRAPGLSDRTPAFLIPQPDL